MRTFCFLLLLSVSAFGQDTANYQRTFTFNHLQRIKQPIKPGKSYPIRQFCTTEIDSVIAGKAVYPNNLFTNGNIPCQWVVYIENDTCLGLTIRVKDSFALAFDSLLFKILPKPRHTIDQCKATFYIWDYEKYSNGYIFREYHHLPNGSRFYTTWYKKSLRL